MSLSAQQIERYTRQIIVPGVGGIAQESLLSSRLMLAGKAADIEPVLGYLVGAGVGEILLQLPISEAAQQDLLIKRSLQLNPDVSVKPAPEGADPINLVLAIGDSEIAEMILPLQLRLTGVPVIFSCLEEPASIAILAQIPPCLSCADTDLRARPRRRGKSAGFVAMVAATEAFKILANLASAPASRLLPFAGFSCASRPLRQKPLDEPCICSEHSPEKPKQN